MRESVSWSRVWSVVRLGTALLALVAVIASAAVVVDGAIESGRHVPTVAANFFGFFTVVSNATAAGALICAVIWFWTRGRDSAAEPWALAVVLAAATTFVLLSGLLYNLPLPGVRLNRNAILPWASVVLHGVVPLVLVADTLLAPKPRALRWSAVPLILSFPLAWTLYTLVRAQLVTNTLTGVPYWYPYSFLNPEQPGGYLAVAAWLAGIAVPTAGIAAIVVAIGRCRGRSIRPR